MNTSSCWGLRPGPDHPVYIMSKAAIASLTQCLGRDHAHQNIRVGEAHELLDAAQMREMTGTDYYCSGLFTPGTAMIQPAAFVRGVAAGLKSARVQLYENSPVVALDHSHGWSAKTPSGMVTAPKVILAVNGHAQSFGHFKQRLLHVFTYASITRALSADECRSLGGVPRWGVTPADPMGTTVRRISGTGGDRIIVHYRFTCDPLMRVNARRLAHVGRDHVKAFAARFPMLNGMEMAYRWGGRLCLSRNNVPAFGEVDQGLYSACCQKPAARTGWARQRARCMGCWRLIWASGEKLDLLTQVLA